MDFKSLLQPHEPEIFMNSVWGRTFLHVRGQPEKFNDLLPWPALNRILREHRLARPRLLLTREAEKVEDSEIIHGSNGRRGEIIPQIMTRELNEKLRDGYTLIINQIDEMHEAITALAEMLEYRFHERAQINAYAAWGRSRGFNVHFDDHDVFVLQVAGRKFWRVYGPSENNSPPKAALWEGMLEQGDLLYLPKGWWHEAVGQGVPTLHLTCGIQNRNGLHLLAWLQQGLRSHKLFCTDLPRFEPLEQQSAHIRLLRNQLTELFDESVLTRYFAEYDARALSRPHLSLPWAPTPGELPEDKDFRVRFAVGRPATLNLTGDGESCELVANGKRWRFPVSLEPILRLLMTDCICSISDLCAVGGPLLEIGTVRLAVSDLLFQGLISVADGEDDKRSKLRSLSSSKSF